MPEENTWESASATPPVESATPVVETPVVSPPVAIPPAEAATLETTEVPQLEVEPAAVRETVSEPQITEPEKVEAKPKDDYVAETDDPPEIAVLPTPAAKRWAKRQFKDALPVHNFLDFDKPISTLGDDLHRLSPSRYTEHVNDIFKRHSKDLLGVPFDEVKSRLQANGKPATTPATEVLSQPVSPITEAELSQMSDADVVQRVQQIQEQTRKEAASEFQKQIDDLRTQFEAVNGEVKTQKETAAQAEIRQKQHELYTQTWSAVDEVIRESGLDADPNDPPKIASLKEAARDLIKKDAEPAFDAVDENTKLVRYVFEATNRREFDNAFRETDNLRLRARTAAESVKSDPKVKAIIDEIEAYANQSKGTSRAANPIPPAPGSSMGVTVKPPTTWDEAVASAAAQ